MPESPGNNPTTAGISIQPGLLARALGCLGITKSPPNQMRPMKLKKIMLAALGSVMGGLSGFLIILPLAGAIQAPPGDKPPTATLRTLEEASNLKAELAGALPPMAEDNPIAGRKVESSSDQPPLGEARESSTEFTGPAFGQEAMDYLAEVGFGVEYGSSSTVLHKWTEDVNLRIYGSPTAADVATLTQVVAELNELITGIELTLNDGPGDVEVHFVPESQFQKIEPHYQPVNYGFFRVWWDHEGAIYRGRILVASEGITQQERSHLIREEITQSLGLFRDSWNYPDSIFYQGWTAIGEYSSIDVPTIRLLYQPQLLPGMTKVEVTNLLSLN